MMFRNILFAVAAGLLLAPLALAEEPKKTSTQAQDKEMSGTWVPTEGMMEGQKLTDNQLNTIKLLLNEGKYTAVVGEGKEEGTYKLDTSKTPFVLDIEPTMGPNKGKKIPAIVEVKGDTMRVCYNLAGADRPKDFNSTAENKYVIMTYRREKDKGK